jgi:peptide/nickel transport system substrate-binding protein
MSLEYDWISTNRRGVNMRSKLTWVIAPGLIVLCAMLLSSCGGGGEEENVTQAKYAPPTSAPDNAQKGGTLTVISSGDVDYIDPGAAYYQYTYMVDSAINRTLVAWQPDDTELPSPDLADSEPVISDDGKTLTFTLQSGIKYSPPVNRDVTSADVKYAVERGLLPGVANGYVAAYLGDLEGFKDAEAAVKKDPTKAPDISGIETPDDQTIVFHLAQPTAVAAEQALSLPISSPVPEEYAKKYDAENPSTYGENQVNTGPYMLDSYSPGKEIKLVRNPNWNPDTDFRPAYLDAINLEAGFSDTVSASKKILTGDAQVNGDFSPPATSLKLAATQYPDQLTLTPSGGNRYMALNTSKPPFDDINVRKAVIANSDRTALVATRGGPLVGPVATHFIPPEIPGFDEAGGLAGPDLDFVKNTKGDPDLAASYMKKAGFSSGKCEGSVCDITMVGENEPPDKDSAEVARDQLEELGFNVNLQEVNGDLMYTKFCNVPKNEPQVCPNVGWIKDFNDPQSILDVPFNGENIVQSNNSNWPLLDDPAINKAMDDAKLITDEDERAQAWGKIDQDVTAQAPAIPWIWDNQANISSSDVAVVINKFNSVTDLSFTSLAK